MFSKLPFICAATTLLLVSIPAALDECLERCNACIPENTSKEMLQC